MRVIRNYRRQVLHEHLGVIPEPYGRLANQFTDAGWSVDYSDDPVEVLFIKKGGNAFGLVYGDPEPNAWVAYRAENMENAVAFKSAKDLFRVINTLIK